MPRGSSGAMVNVSLWARGSFPALQTVLELGHRALQCQEQREPSPARPICSHPTHTLLTKAHGPAALDGSCWAQHNVLAFLLILSHDAKGSPPPPSPSSLMGFTGASAGSLGRAAQSIGSAALPLSPRDFLPAAPGKASGQGAPVMGLLPPTAEGPSNKKGVLGFTMSTLGTNETQNNVLGFKDFYFIFLFCFYLKKSP